MWGLWVSKGFGDSRSAAAMRTSLSSCKVSAAGELTPNPRLGGNACIALYNCWVLSQVENILSSSSTSFMPTMPMGCSGLDTMVNALVSAFFHVLKEPFSP